jgi:hypothetical protein
MEQLPTAQMENKHMDTVTIKDSPHGKASNVKRMNYKHMFITTYIDKSNPFFSKNQGLKNKSWASC